MSAGFEYYGMPCHLLLGKKMPLHVFCLFVCFSLLPIYHTIFCIIHGFGAREEVRYTVSTSLVLENRDCQVPIRAINCKISGELLLPLCLSFPTYAMAATYYLLISMVKLIFLLQISIMASKYINKCLQLETS